MHVVVLGAGLLGVTTAYYLAEEGHQVTVIDRQSEPARETSFANAGLLTPGHASAWASPRAPMILLKSLWRKDTSLRYRLKLDPRMWAWSLKFLANCTAEKNRRNTLIKLRLCAYSAEETDRLTKATDISWERNQKGAIYLYREREHFRQGREHLKMMVDNGVEAQVLEVDELVALEPALAGAKHRLVGAIHTPNDESGDARKFTLALAEVCKLKGVNFRFGVSIGRIDSANGRVVGVTIRGKDGADAFVTADAYVLALGSYSPILARQVGVDLPIYPVKGYSLTMPLLDPAQAPTRGGVDEGNLVAFARLGDRLRFTSTADFAGYDTEFQPSDFTHMMKVARELFPNGGAYDKPDYWACLRPMTPDGPPIMGSSPISNFWLNTGHGHMGWTMAAGSSRIVVDRMLGREPAIDDKPFALARY